MPEKIGWVDHQDAVDETEFTPWADKGWMSHNGQSPEIAVVDFVVKLVRMMQPSLVVETGVGQGYMTRALAAALTEGELWAYESDDAWRALVAKQSFWKERKNALLSVEHTPSTAFLQADLSILDSDFLWRFQEVRLWDEHAKPGAVAIIHDTSDRDGTIHQTLRELITNDLGMTGVFLNNPRGCFMAVQPKEKG